MAADKPLFDTQNVDALFNYANNLQYGDLHIKFDPATQFTAIIAIHNTHRGPSLGGCRFIPYHHAGDALYDAIRLAQAMSFKSALADLPAGGGKSVIIKPSVLPAGFSREQYLTQYAKFVQSLGGRYIAAPDSGTQAADMDIIADSTKYVSCISAHGDPGPATAQGLCLAIQAGVKHRLNREELTGLHIAIQGVGSVGYHLMRELLPLGVRLTISDINEALVAKCLAEFAEYKIDTVAPKDVHKVACDIFSPCALGGILNQYTIPEIQATMVIGSANNQLAESADGERLSARGILYGPDYAVNSGGIVHSVLHYYEPNLTKAREQTQVKIKHIYQTCLEIFARADFEKQPTNVIADILAAERLT